LVTRDSRAASGVEVERQALADVGDPILFRDGGPAVVRYGLRMIAVDLAAREEDVIVRVAGTGDGSMPWYTAFSSSGCSTSGGTSASLRHALQFQSR